MKKFTFLYLAVLLISLSTTPIFAVTLELDGIADAPPGPSVFSFGANYGANEFRFIPEDINIGGTTVGISFKYSEGLMGESGDFETNLRIYTRESGPFTTLATGSFNISNPVGYSLIYNGPVTFFDSETIEITVSYHRMTNGCLDLLVVKDFETIRPPEFQPTFESCRVLPGSFRSYYGPGDGVQILTVEEYAPVVYLEITPDLPNPAIPLNPAIMAMDVPINTLLSFEPAPQSYVEGYLLNLGTNYPPTNILSMSNIGLDTSYKSELLYQYDTTYFWQVIPYNETGQALNCPIWEFHTELGSSGIVALDFWEDFQNVPPFQSKVPSWLDSTIEDEYNNYEHEGWSLEFNGEND